MLSGDSEYLVVARDVDEMCVRIHISKALGSLIGQKSNKHPFPCGCVCVCGCVWGDGIGVLVALPGNTLFSWFSIWKSGSQ